MRGSSRRYLPTAPGTSYNASEVPTPGPCAGTFQPGRNPCQNRLTKSYSATSSLRTGIQTTSAGRFCQAPSFRRRQKTSYTTLQFGKCQNIRLGSRYELRQLFGGHSLQRFLNLSGLHVTAPTSALPRTPVRVMKPAISSYIRACQLCSWRTTQCNIDGGSF